MHQLIYVSTARAGTTAADVDAILAASRSNNARDNTTGLLIYDGKRFLQALEGYGPLVEAAFTRIKADPRHRAAVMLSFRENPDRQFGRWEMACQKVSPVSGDGTLAATVDALVAEVSDPNTRALFSGFARVNRRAA